MKLNIETIFFGFIALVLTSMAVGQFVDAQHELSTSKVDYVNTICQKAHLEVSGESEQACGDAQDETNTEFLCDVTGNNCWTEEK